MFAGSERGLSCARTSSTRTWRRASASSRSSADFPRQAGGTARGAAGTDQGRSPRSAKPRGRREHLRRRGALASANRSEADRRRARCARDPRAPPRHPSLARGRDRAPGSDPPRLSDARRGGGGMQHEFKVYGRAGEPCPRCGAPIEKTRVGGRGTLVLPGLPALNDYENYAASCSSSQPLLSSRQSSV